MNKGQKTNQMNKKYYLAILIVIVGLLGFFGGMNYGKSQASISRSISRGSQAGAGSRFANGNGFVSGSIISLDANSVTLSTQGGGSRIIFFSTSTQIMKSAQGTIKDLTANSNVVVSGTQNSDGSITATSIQLRPQTPQIPQNQ